MSQFSTGELARLCDVSIRTVQFYDTKGILSPSDFTEGGRRLYSENDLKQFRLICMLKSLGLSLSAIKGILQSPAPGKVLLLLLDEQLKQIEGEIEDKQTQKRAITMIQKNIQSSEPVSINSIRDIEQMMKSKKKLRKVHGIMLTIGIIMDIMQMIALFYWIFKGIWLPFVILMPIVMLMGWLMVRFYYKHTAYICPECGTTFKPAKKEFFFAKHTPKTRKLTCTNCGHNGFCVETANPDIS